MEWIKQQVVQLCRRIGGLNSGQKMLLAGLSAVVAVTILWWAHGAGEPEMQPVLDQAIPAEDLTRIAAQLAGRGIPYHVSADKVFVPADRKLEVLSDLGYAQLLPRDISTGFDQIVKQMSPWDSWDKTQEMWNRAKEITLAQVIRNFPRVSNAVVLIDPRSEQHFDENSVEPVATVNIMLRDPGGPGPGRQLVNAAAAVVAGAQAGLSRDRISVIVDGVSYPVQAAGTEATDGGDEIVQAQQIWERHYADNIRQSLSFIHGAMVSVSVDLNVASHHKTIHQTHDENFQQNPPDADRPPEDPDPAAAHQTKLASEETDVQVIPSGGASVVAAAVGIPRSYFVGMYKIQNPGSAEPNDAALAPMLAQELPKIRRCVKACVGLRNDQDVTVDMFYDLPVAAVSPSAPAAGGGMGFPIGSWARQIALGALAAVSLTMMLWLVARRPGSAPMPSIASPRRQRVDADLDRMANRVALLVKQNPDAAADVVRQWLNR